MTEATERAGVRFEVGKKPRARAYLGGHLVADTVRPVLVWEIPNYPAYYFSMDDVRATLAPTGETVHSDDRGDADVYDIVTPTATARSAALRYPESPHEAIRSLVRIQWGAMDEWLEEDEPVYTHPRDPHTRVDILASSRRVRIELDGVVLAESERPHILFETGLRPRYYLPMSDVRLDLLVPSDTRTHCPYKGTASYWSVVLGDTTYPDYVWGYRSPLPESQKIAGMLCFFNEKVAVSIDGLPED